MDLGTKSRGPNGYFDFTDDAFRGAPKGTYVTGEGWVDGGPGLGANDFLFTATPVPLPAAAWFLLAGVGGLGFIGRSKKTS